jgi:membrane-associated phospholipid phosphatase
VLRLVDRIGRKLPQGWGDLGRQIGLLVLVDLAYETVRGLADGQRAVAFAHGQQVIDFEKATHTFFEPGFQAFVVRFSWLIDFANQVYMNSQFAVVITFFFWLYMFRNDSYYFVRNMFMVSMGLALIGYSLYPTAPPRLYPEFGFVDTINDYSSVNHDSALAKLFINPYAAVPSMHCAFALMVGLTAAKLSRRWYTRALFAMWPVLVICVVVVTGNHYWLDAALGAGVAALSAFTALQLARARPHAWAWQPSTPQEAEA